MSSGLRADETYFKVLLGPVVTEKSNLLANGELKSGNSFMFRVVPEATKATVKRAIEKIFEVKVEGVRIHNRKPRRGRQIARGKFGIHKGRKMAYVKLAAGQDLDYSAKFGD